MPKSFSPPTTRPFDIRDLKMASTVELTTHEISQSKEKVREKNALREGKLTTSDGAFLSCTLSKASSLDSRDMGAFLHVVKSSLGSGFLAMPYAFHNIGLLLGFVGTALVALICAHCTHILVKCSQELCYLRNVEAMNYIDTVEWAFRVGANRRWVRYSGLMRSIANVFMFVTYYGVNTVYVILIASSFKQVLENHLEYSMNIRWYVLLLLILLLPIGIVRHMKFLVPFSALANVFLLIGCSLTLYLCLVDMPPLTSRPLAVEVSRWPLFFSTALFGMEGIGTIMPIENSMRNPRHFLGCPSVLNCGMTVVASMFLLVGSVGYVKYGEEVQGSITLNLPQDMLSELVKILVALAVLLTYPLQLTASVDVVWNEIKHRFSDERQDYGYYCIRSLLIIGTVVIAFAVPNLSPVLSLVGAIGFSTAGLLLPTIVELVTFWDRLTLPCGLIVVKNIVLIVIWAFATVSGSITSINEIIVEYAI